MAKDKNRGGYIAYPWFPALSIITLLLCLAIILQTDMDLVIPLFEGSEMPLHAALSCLALVSIGTSFLCMARLFISTKSFNSIVENDFFPDDKARDDFLVRPLVDLCHRPRKAYGYDYTSSFIDSCINDRHIISKYSRLILIILGLMGTVYNISIHLGQPDYMFYGAAAVDSTNGLGAISSGVKSDLGVAFAPMVLSLLFLTFTYAVEFLSIYAHKKFRYKAWLFTSDYLPETMSQANDTMDNSQQNPVYLFSLIERQITQMSTLCNAIKGDQIQHKRIADDMSNFIPCLDILTQKIEVMYSSVDRFVAALEIENSYRKDTSLPFTDDDVRQHIRNIDFLIMRMLEENSVGRNEILEMIHRCIETVTSKIENRSDGEDLRRNKHYNDSDKERFSNDDDERFTSKENMGKQTNGMDTAKNEEGDKMFLSSFFKKQDDNITAEKE